MRGTFVERVSSCIRDVHTVMMLEEEEKRITTEIYKISLLSDVTLDKESRYIEVIDDSPSWSFIHGDELMLKQTELTKLTADLDIIKNKRREIAKRVLNGRPTYSELSKDEVNYLTSVIVRK
eukprot:GHVH01008707.1.p1 GENE.GHVH01008707.1~~GHVH01008707.1.p1  ORF type:complete len:122 (+),score=17.52 GHVH01008707.1:21-386(+)